MEYKILYNYSESAIYEDKNNWLEGCIIIKAESFLEAQEKFIEMRPHNTIKDIELLN